MDSYSIGVDLGGTNLRVAAMSEDGTILQRHAVSTPAHSGAEAIVDAIAGGVSSVRGQISGRNLVGVGIGVPGFILMESGQIVGSANLPALDGYPVRAAIEKQIGAPIILENDANAAALGEYWMGAGRNAKDLVMLTLGTGVGGGIIVDGRVLHGYLGMAGELGHLTVSPNGYPCGCGNAGCLEKYASATAVSAMARLMNLGDNLTSQQVSELALGGNERATRVFEAMGTALGSSLAGLVNIFNFPLYLLGGGVTAAWDLFAPSMLAEATRRSLTFRSHPPEVKRATLGGDAGLFGAAYLPLQAAAAR